MVQLLLDRAVNDEYNEARTTILNFRLKHIYLDYLSLLNAF